MMELNAFKRYVGLCLLLGQDTPPYQKREPFVQDTLALISGLPSATQLSAQLCESQPPSLDNSAFPVLTGYQASDILSVARDIWSDENVINLSLRLRMMRAANHTHWDRWPVMRFSHESYHETALNSRSLQAHYLRNEWKDAVREGLTFLQTQVPLAPKFETDSYRSQIRVFLYGALETDFSYLKT
ncbi:MAG: hypothetical protein IPJ69_13070 [Deltaproteobacteria bacterium]|nr:MAG: hypothetical protein IPJ69_13070 [Deltaproteobacteria bacterium]